MFARQVSENGIGLNQHEVPIIETWHLTKGQLRLPCWQELVKRQYVRFLKTLVIVSQQHSDGLTTTWKFTIIIVYICFAQLLFYSLLAAQQEPYKKA